MKSIYPIFYLKNANLAFGKKHIVENLSIYIYPQDKISLVGKNGSGKSSLLKIIANIYSIDSGEKFQNKNISIGYLDQNNHLSDNKNSIDYLASYKNKEETSEMFKIIENLKINKERLINELSGGEVKKILLAKTLMQKPDILLLDEPTNHLDIGAIEWLEQYLNEYPGAVICISHDKLFQSNISHKIWWLYQTTIYKSEEKGFKYFDQWQEEVLKQEQLNLKKLNQKLNIEQQWLLTGISARRKRNQKRLDDLYKLRTNILKNKEILKNNKLQIEHQILENKFKTKKIIEISSISFKKENSLLFKDFSLDIIKGEKIGIMGDNGSGKTTLVNILRKKIQPTSGYIKHANTIKISYFDQQKTNLDLSKNIAENLSPGGSEYILVNEESVHLRVYLKKFMFDPSILYENINLFSGGELTRLSLAKTFINMGNLLILDEPTNDLDIDSLEKLLQILSDYKGTLLIVSHDRDFLNQLVTKTLIIKNNQILEHIGSFQGLTKSNKAKLSKIPSKNITKIKTNSNKKQLSYKHKRLIEILPQEIEKLESEIKSLEQSLSEDDLTQNDPKKFLKLCQELEIKQNILNGKLNDWINL